MSVKNVRPLLTNFLTALQNPIFGKLTEFPQSKRIDSFRLLEKTPKNALRIPFLKKLFGDAKFIYLYRRPEGNISSIIDGWKSGRFVTYPDLPDWNHEYLWSYLLPEGWRDFNDKTISEIAWFQYKSANDAILSAISSLPSEDVFYLEYDDFLHNKVDSMQKLCSFCDVPFGPRMKQLLSSELPLSRYTLDAPNTEKWHRNKEEMRPILDEAIDYYNNVLKK